MKKLKKKFRKVKKIAKTTTTGLNPILRKKIVLKPKGGQWCDYYIGRLPYPIECQTNKHIPVSHVFNKGKMTLMYDRTKCIECTRNVEFIHWKKGFWDDIIEAIEKGEDLRKMDAPKIKLD